jgi:predicted RNase H-like HicB family nuclease
MVALDRRMKVSVLLRRGRNTGSVQAYCPDLPGCSAHGPTEGDALELLRHRITDYFAHGRPVPPGERRTVLEL